MRVNLEWLREWAGFDLDPDELAERLTIGGLEVDSVEPLAPLPAEIVVAEVEDVRPHPQADRLSLCTVNDGAGRHSVVCGAANVRSGLRTAFAPAGTTLPGGRAVENRALRGTVSEGVLCSAQELELGDDASGLLELAADAPVGTPLTEHLRLDDTVLDIDLTPNRGDCFSVLGVARETAALHGAAFDAPGVQAVPPRIDDTFAVELTAGEACPRFVGRVIRNLTTDRISPPWMRERLRRAGLRPIHPVVDVTNYVMLELGQPLHAYDLNKLETGISVRFGQAGETVMLLDGTPIALSPDVLVIADQSGAIGLAGIMGGEGTAVEASTRDVFLEAAFFSPGAIMGRARRFGLHTDASLRFERGVDPAHQARAIERATGLLAEIAGGDPGPVVVTEEARFVPTNTSIGLRHGRLQSVLGVSVKPEIVEQSLGVLGMDVRPTDGGWQVVPPTFRFDLSIEEDLIEEVGRIIGYDRIPALPESGERHLGTATETRVTEARIVDLLTARGYSEVITYGFVDEALEAAVNPGVEPVRLANPISQELRVMRRSLWPGLLTTARQNLSRQQTRLRLLEVGAQFSRVPRGVRETRVVAGLAVGRQWPEHWANDTREVDFFDVKADLEAVFGLTGHGDRARFSPAAHPALTPGQCARIVLAGDPVGWLGALHPGLQQRLELKSPTILFALRLDPTAAANVPAYERYSKFPSVRRDLAVVLDETISGEQVIDCVRETVGERLQGVTLFDIYRGTGIDSGRKSVALGLIFRDKSRTLTDEETDRAMASVRLRLEHEFGATIRK